MEKQRNQQIRTDSKTALVEQINLCLGSGDYSRALDLLRNSGSDFRNDAKLSELEKLGQDGLKRNAEANRLITESQNLFAQQKSDEAIQLLRQAYELDKHNPLARAILANALVEHAHSKVETDWRGAEALAKQALEVNPAHPTAKSIRSLVLDRKKASSVEDWVAQARKLQSSGDLFAALAWVEEGMAFHPDDPKLIQVQDGIQRDQAAQRRQSRRRDLEELRRMEGEIDRAADTAARQALAERVQRLAAKYWTDGEILSVANALLLRLGFAPQKISSASPQGKAATVIFHVPQPTAPKPSRPETSQVAPIPAPPEDVRTEIVLPKAATPENIPSAKVAPVEVKPIQDLAIAVLSTQVPTASPEPSAVKAQPVAMLAEVAPPKSQPKRTARPNATTLILVSAAAIVLVAVAATFFFTRKHYGSQAANSTAAPAVSAPPSVAPAPEASVPVQQTPESSPPVPSGTIDGKVTPSAPQVDAQRVISQPATNAQPTNAQPFADSGHSPGTLLVVAGQDDAKIFLNGKLQPQLTQSGQLRLPNLEPKDYVVDISKPGFQNPPQQKIRIRKGEEARLVFKLEPQNLQAKSLQPQRPQPQKVQPQPSMASLTIQGGVPGTTVLVDQTPVGTVQPDGTLSISSVDPGDHTLELRKERFKPRQLKKHFLAGGAISLAAADAALEAAPSELKITFTPADAKVAVVKGDLLKMVSSGVPLNVPPGTYTLSARTADGFTRSSTLEVVAGQSRTVDLPLAPNGMSNWDDAGGWKHEGESFTRKGGDFVLYRDTPASGTFIFSAMPSKGRLLQWVLNYTDPKNYVLLQMDDNNFYRTVIRNGVKTDAVIIPDKADKKSFRMLHIRISPTEIVHQIKHGNSWTILDRWTQPGANLSPGKFGFYIPGNDQVALSSFAHYVDLNIR